MRGTVPGLQSPHPLGDSLPGLYQEDRFAQDLCAALDEVIAPILATLDALPAYFDPATAPEDMLGWLAGWLGLALDDHQTADRHRELVRTGMELLRWRGTARGVRDAVEALFDVAPEVTESGGTSWSVQADGPLPGSGSARLNVRLGVPNPDTFDVRRLDALIATVKPAHIPHGIEVYPLG